MSRLGDTPVCFSPPRFVLEATRVRWYRWPWMEQPPGQVSGPEARRGARHVRGRRSAGGRRQSLCSCRTVKADVTLQKATYSGGHKVKSRQSQEGDGSEKRNKQEGSGHDTRPQGQEQEAGARGRRPEQPPRGACSPPHVGVAVPDADSEESFGL